MTDNALGHRRNLIQSSCNVYKCKSNFFSRVLRDKKLWEKATNWCAHSGYFLARCFRDEILASFMSARFIASRFRCQDELESWNLCNNLHCKSRVFSLLPLTWNFLCTFADFKFFSPPSDSFVSQKTHTRKNLARHFKMIEIGSQASRSRLKPIINYRLITPLSVKCPKQNKRRKARQTFIFLIKDSRFLVCFFLRLLCLTQVRIYIISSWLWLHWKRISSLTSRPSLSIFSYDFYKLVLSTRKKREAFVAL